MSLGTTEKLNNRIRYTGQQYDDVTGQYYLRARYYNPVAGRFMQEDVYQGDGLNLYAYCGNNPVVYDDPSGYASTSTGKACPPQGKISESVDGSGRDIVPDKGFSSFKDLKTHLDSPGDGKVWHHIVEQSQITGSGFSSEQVNNINNVIAIPHGKGSIHAKISGYYSSKQFFTGGKTVRQWLAGQDFKTQFDFGMNLLKEYGDVIPSSKGWIFRTFE